MNQHQGFIPKWLDIWRAGHGGQDGIQARQEVRLQEIVAHAQEHSAFYKTHCRCLGTHVEDIRLLPPVTKRELMANFDTWVTDPVVTPNGVEEFIEDRKRIGQAYLERYSVWRTSGVTGDPGFFLHDAQAMMVYGALALMRGLLPWMTGSRLWAFLRRGGRIAGLIATGGHFAGPAISESLRGVHPWFDRHIRTFSVLEPVPKLVEALNEFRPAMLVSYPTVLALLAGEQQAGRLRIEPALAITAAEWLSQPLRDEITAAFHCPVRDVYAASEFMGIAYECRQGWLHLNADWVILEPVDRDYNPVPPGQVSHTVLLTNLINRVQPILRYDLGDSVLVKPDPCECGSPLPAIRVEGRRDEILYLETNSGETVPLLPMAVAAVVEETPGVLRFQVVQTAPARLEIRLEVEPGAEDERVWGSVARSLSEFMYASSLTSVTLERAQEIPRRDLSSGKFRQVFTQLPKRYNP